MNKGKVYLLTGKVACGKTTYARKFEAEGKAILLSVDELQLYIYGSAPTREQLDNSYEGCFKYQKSIALKLLKLGIDVYIDWGFWSKADRENARKFFEDNDVNVTLVYFDISDDERRLRNAKRNLGSDKHSFKIEEKDIAMFDSFFEPPSSDEYDVVIKG